MYTRPEKENKISETSETFFFHEVTVRETSAETLFREPPTPIEFPQIVFASFEHCNFTFDFLKVRFLEPI